jgi:aminoglycoside 6'-N-acetyltransferase
VLDGERVRLRPVAEGDIAGLREILVEPAVARWWPPDALDDWPVSEDTVQLAILVDGVVAGMIQFSEEEDPRYRHAGIDLFLSTNHHGRGLGSEAITVLARHLIEDLGHHRLVIDPARANEPAIRCYERVGFRPVGVMRRYERDHVSGAWVDGLLMELLAGELGGSTRT